MSALDEVELVKPGDRGEWRRWLEANHAQAARVWVAIGKKESTSTSLRYEQAVEEALCFGWIDGVMRPVDAQCYRQLFARRKPRSSWSRTNKKRVERLEAQGLMTPAGRAAIEQAQANGSWSRLDQVEDLVVPEDLAAALASEPGARRNFDGFPASARKAFLSWILAVKSPEKRAERVAGTVRLAAAQRRLSDESIAWLRGR